MPASSSTDIAQSLAQRGRVADAAALLDRAMLSGDADAAFLMAVWRLVGQPLPRDLPSARQALRRAAAAGHADAALMEVALTANGSGATADWPGALALLEEAARRHPPARAVADLIRAMRIGGTGHPIDPREPATLCDAPPIQRFERFLTPAECHHVMDAVTDIMAPSVVVDPATGRQIANPIRTSDGAVIGPTRETLAIRAINHRIASISGTATDQGESLTVLRYAPQQQYRMHHDALSGVANQRIMTVLIYLNDDFDGGATEFPELGITVTPRRGDAVLFHNVLPDGRIDQRTRHAGLPVTRGVKWLATRWIRARDLNPWDPRTAA